MVSPPATTSSNSITRRFDALKKASRRALVCYVTAGHPDVDRSLETLRALEEGGADIIELGVPFSDPIADGPIIQASSQQALEKGMTYDGVLAIIAAAKPSVPVVLFSYLNPILAAGADALSRAAVAGASGILVTDIPVGADPAREEWLGSSPLAGGKLMMTLKVAPLDGARFQTVLPELDPHGLVSWGVGPAEAAS